MRPLTRIRRYLFLVGLVLSSRGESQTPVTREQAVAAAQQRGARLKIARSDSLAAEALRVVARARPNPTLSAAWSASVPRDHVSLDIPIDAPWLRSARIRTADFLGEAARARYAYERAAVGFEAESTYTAAIATEARARLSHRTAVDAESLLTLARLRRDAGDASELDVAVAEVSAGQLANAAADDSIRHVGALLEVQRVMGLRADTVQIVLSDSLAPPSARPPPRAFGVHPTLPVLAATASLGAARAAMRFARRSVFDSPSITVGFETADPAQPGLLPTVGLSLPLPLFDRRRGPIGLASAGLIRAEAELDLARRESGANITRAIRERDAALERVRRDSRLLASAERVLQLSVVAYREGAQALPFVLEAARNAREAFSRYIDDVAVALTADASLRWLTASWEN